MAKWNIPAPEWTFDPVCDQWILRINDAHAAFVRVSNGAIEIVIWDVDDTSLARKAEGSIDKAKELALAEAMDVLGATPLDMPELSPADTVMTAEQVADRPWNEAIEAAAVVVERWNSEAAMAAPGIRALKRGDGNE